MVSTLVELYFDHVYNASLLLHRPSFTSAVAVGTVRRDILLGVCALGSIFYKDRYHQNVLLANGISYTWAERASQLAFQEVQLPREENIVSLLTLTLFWYSRGNYRRASMHECCASNTAFVIGLPTNRTGNQNSLHAELSRRRFWACYLLSTFQAWSLFPKTPSEAVQTLRLPCQDDDFDMGTPQGKFTMDSGKGNNSIFAELIKVINLWSAVEALIKQPESSSAVLIAGIQDLDERIQSSWADVPAELQLDALNISSVSMDRLAGRLTVQLMYHQCLCALHSSIVPLFSWGRSDGRYLYARQVSAQTALEHANSMSSLLAAASNLAWEANRLPGFIGYAAYCACAIQMPFLWCLNPEVKQRTIQNVMTDLRTLYAIGGHWQNVHILGKYAHRLYKAHARRPFPLEDEPKNMTATAMSGWTTAASRVRLSILTHNKVLLGDEGDLARQIEDVADIGLANSDPNNAAAGDSDHIEDFMSEISREEQILIYQFPFMVGPLPLSDLDLSNFENDSAFTTETSNHDQIGSIEDWFSMMNPAP